MTSLRQKAIFQRHSYLGVAKSPRIAASLRQEESKAWGLLKFNGRQNNLLGVISNL